MIFSLLLKREKKIILAVLIILLCIILYGFVLEPAFKGWVQLDNSISAKKIKLHKYVKLTAGLKAKNSEYRKYAPADKNTKSEEQELSVLLSNVEELARKSNVYLDILKPVSVKDEKLYKKFLVEAELETAMNDLMGFFYEIENSPLMLKVETVDMAAKPGQKDIIKVRLLISKILFKEA